MVFIEIYFFSLVIGILLYITFTPSSLKFLKTLLALHITPSKDFWLRWLFMFGVKHPSVSMNATKLQEMRFIKYNRGNIQIID